MKIASILLNKYLLSIAFFVVWMGFFDQRDFFFIREQKKKLSELEVKKAYYKKEIDQAAKDLDDMQHSSAALEKFARERYMMKKDGEDIFIIEDTPEIKK